jgi:hypothetical protein
MDITQQTGTFANKDVLTWQTRWIAAFVLVVNNFERVSCRVNRWHGMVVCSRQHTVEAFAFIALYDHLHKHNAAPCSG